MTTAGKTAVVVTLLTLLHCTGCSWIFMQRAPHEYKNQACIECSGKALPTVDLVIAGSNLLGAVAMLIAALSPGGDQCTTQEGELLCITPRDAAKVVVPVFALTALIHGLSAWSGYRWARECRAVKNQHNRWQLSLPPEERRAFERRVVEKHCDTLESRMKMLPSKVKMKQYISECRDVIRYRAAQTDSQGQNQLHRATREADERRVRILLMAGADPNARDNYGWTPLHYAAAAGEEKIVKMLLARGADPLARNHENQTPIHLAHDKGHADIVKILHAHAGKRKEKSGEQQP